MMAQLESEQRSTYRIILKGTLNRSALDWFEDITRIVQENDETLMVGQFADQAALRGFVDQLWNLNFTVLSVERIENQSDFDSCQESDESKKK